MDRIKRGTNAKICTLRSRAYRFFTPLTGVLVRPLAACGRPNLFSWSLLTVILTVFFFFLFSSAAVCACYVVEAVIAHVL